MPILSRFILRAACILALPVLAQTPTRMGLQVGLLRPQSDVLRSAVDDKTGLDAGIHLALDLGHGHALRPRLDYLHFPTRTDTYTGGVKSDYKLSGLSLGMDYLYHLEQAPQGFYVLAGLAMNRWKIASEDISIITIYPNPPVVTRTPVSETSTKVALAVGAGYQFTPQFGLEGRYQVGRIFNADANLFQAGITFRF